MEPLQNYVEEEVNGVVDSPVINSRQLVKVTVWLDPVGNCSYQYSRKTLGHQSQSELGISHNLPNRS